MPEYRVHPCPASFRARDQSDGPPQIEAYFAVYDDSYEMFPGYVERLAPGLFDSVDLTDIRCLIDHETRLVLGRTAAGTLGSTQTKKACAGSSRSTRMIPMP